MAHFQFLCNQLYCLCFILIYFIHLDLNFIQSDEYSSVLILQHAEIQIYQHHLLKMLSFIPCIIMASLPKRSYVPWYVGLLLCLQIYFINQCIYVHTNTVHFFLICLVGLFIYLFFFTRQTFCQCSLGYHGTLHIN